MNDEQVRFASGMNIMLALWQIFSPFLLGYADNALALWNGLIVGAAILVLAWLRTVRPTRSALPSWINLLLGAWLAVSPFALGITSVDMAMWNDITVGISVVFFSLTGLALTTTHRPKA